MKYVLVCSVLDFGAGSKALALARNLGAVGETVFLGKGTVKEKWLAFLGASKTRKEILVAIAAKGGEEKIYQAFLAKFGLDKPNRGIVFSIPLKQFYCIGGKKSKSKATTNGVETVAYEAIFVIVNKGLSEEVVEAAESAGSTGGTIIHGRGSGTQEKAVLFNIEIEPEKDIVLIISKCEKTDAITEAIETRLGISDPGAGIVFVLDVSRTLGLFEG